LDPEKITLSETTGEVVSYGTGFAHSVSGSGGSVTVSPASGHICVEPVRITSSATKTDQIILRLRDGSETSLNLQGFRQLACRPGHELTAVMAQTPADAKKNQGWWIAVYNHGTDEMSWNDARVNELAKPTPFLIVLLLVSFWFVAIAWSPGLGLMLGWIPAFALTVAIVHLWSVYWRARLRELTRQRIQPQQR